MWDDINAPYYQEKLTRLKSDLQALEQSGGNLDSAKLRWESTKADLVQIQKNLKELSAQLGRISHTLQTAKVELKNRKLTLRKVSLTRFDASLQTHRNFGFRLFGSES